jgi:hypothetical protein
MPTLVTMLRRLRRAISQPTWLIAQAARMPTLVTTLRRLHQAITRQRPMPCVPCSLGI